LGAIELPILRLGLAGFSPEQERAIEAAAAASRITHWACSALAGADAWLINGQFAQHLGDGRIRIASRQTGGRSVQVQLSEAKRPVAIAQPAPAGLVGVSTFEIANPQSILEAIGVFEFVLAAEAAQFLLASHIVEQQDALGTGVFELRAKGQLIAVVDMKGDACVLPSARPLNFDLGVWSAIDRERMRVPANFVRASLAQLMWRYVSRTTRDVLPERYRRKRIFFRRPPRIEPVLVDEEHLLVMRELAIRPASFDELKARLEMGDELLARTLAALYYVGSITTNRSRAGPNSRADDTSTGLRINSNYGELRSGHGPVELADLRQLTAPAPLGIVT
jgi:hypothetical protein